MRSRTAGVKTTLMRNGRDRRLGKPVRCHARKERVLLFGTRSADHIRASGQSGCIQRPDTWLHPNASLKRQIPLAPRAPSIHGTFETCRPVLRMSVHRGSLRHARTILRMSVHWGRPEVAVIRSNQRELVELRCGAVALGRTYLLPPLSSGGSLVVPPWLRFHIPLIEPDRQISRIRLSDKTSRFRVQRHLQLLNICWS